ncbi:MAG TPA: ATP-binding protein [Candidatus Angelobacter sp.]|nr:ATP-binding protein [Candidatus Angelobacter sp.]
MKADGGPMRFFNNMRIRDKIFVGYLMAMLAVVGVAIPSWRYLAATDQRFEQALGRDVPQLLALEHLRDKAATLIHAVDVFAGRMAANQLRTGDSNSLAAERTAMQDAERDLAGFLAAFAGDLRSAHISATDPRSQILAAGDAVLSIPKGLSARADSGATANELLEIAEGFDTSAIQFCSLIDGAIANEERALATMHEETRDAQAQATWLIGSGILCLILVMLACGYTIANRIAQPIVRLRAAMTRVGEGDFAAIEELSTRDEVGALVDAIRAMVNKLQEAGKELGESEVKFRTLVGNIPGVFYRCANDTAYTMEFISPAVQALSGYPASDFIGNKVRTYASVIHADDMDLVNKAVEDGLNQRQAYVIEYRVVHRDGSTRWAREYGQGIFGEAGELLHLDGAVFDVTERRRMEGELRQALDQAKEAMDKLSRQDRLAALGQVAGTVSHELRNPLAAIRNSMALIRQLTADKGLGVERAMDRVERNIARCNGIISDLLEFTRKRDLNRMSTAIDGWLAEMLDEHTMVEGVAVVRELSSSGVVALDRDRFRQVMVNLLDNAAQAMTISGWSPTDGRRPTIAVKTEAAGPHVRLSVADNGPGISTENLAKIFEPLFTTKASGVGLGLPTVRTIVEQHGGTIDVESAVDAGTTFVVWLPRQSADAALPDDKDKEQAA